MGMMKLAREVRRSRPDTIVIASPHNLRLRGHLSIALTRYSSGKLEASPGNKEYVSLKVKCDSELAVEILDEAKKNRLPVIGANYGTADGPSSDMPMDWGTLVPLWFLTKGAWPKPKVVIVTPCREIPLLKNFEFGRIIGRVAEEKKSKRIVFVASADQAHTFKKSGPYGYNRRASEYDRFVMEAITGNKLHEILKTDPRLVDQAKPDSLWQMTILAGIMNRIPMIGEIVSYEVPTYFGMICASFQRAS
jgi:aromatic ring-opening dioxygenase LigB subunit